MTALGREFFFPFSHCTRVDVMFSHLGDELTDVEVEVFNQHGEPVQSRRFLDVPERGSITTREDAKADNLSRAVGANMIGLVSIHGASNALLSATALIIGKGMTSCALLRPLPMAVGTQLHATVAIGDKFHVLLANPHAAEAVISVEVAVDGARFELLQDPIRLGRNHVALTEDVLGVGRPVAVRLACARSTPFLAWGLGIGGNRTELYPLNE
ncbi:MAG: hypothetical protein ABI333_04890 [bacterium]